jgi:hypothetical protein
LASSKKQTDYSHSITLARLFASNERYKGRTKTKVVERDFLHHVYMMVPVIGFGTHLDAMHDWHHTRGVLALHGSGWRDENGRNYIRWCFVIRS